MTHLSQRQSAFVRNYLKNGGNATKAYLDAGYKESPASRFCASQLLTKPHIAAMVHVKVAVKEIAADKKTIADMIECEERLTTELRGESYAQDITDLEGDLTEMRDARASMRKIMEANGISSEAMANLAATVGNLSNSIVQVRVQIKSLRLKQRAESNAAAVNLMKAKGAFDPRHPAVTDVGAVLNATLRNIIDSKWQPPEHLTDWMKQAEDAVFSLGAGDPGEARKALPGGAPAKVPPVLFTRKDPKQATA